MYCDSTSLWVTPLLLRITQKALSSSADYEPFLTAVHWHVSVGEHPCGLIEVQFPRGATLLDVKFSVDGTIHFDRDPVDFVVSSMCNTGKGGRNNG